VAEMRTERPFEQSSNSPMPVRWTRRIRRRSSSSSNPATATPGVGAPPGVAGFATRGDLAGAPAAAGRAALRRSVVRAMGLEVRDHAAQRQTVALDPEARDRADGDAGDERAVPERFTRLGIRHMHL